MMVWMHENAAILEWSDDSDIIVTHCGGVSINVVTTCGEWARLCMAKVRILNLILLLIRIILTVIDMHNYLSFFQTIFCRIVCTNLDMKKINHK